MDVICRRGAPIAGRSVRHIGIVRLNSRPVGLPPRKNVFKRGRIYISLLALPFVVLFVAMSYVPIFGWAYAFVNFKPGIPFSQSPFVGLKFFQLMFFYAEDLLRVLRNTLVMSGLGLICSPLPIVLAILLSELRFKRFGKIVQTTTTLPHFVSWIIVFSLTFSMFSTEGVVNGLLINLGLIRKPLQILGNGDVVWRFQTILGIWKSIGWSSIIYLAAIAGIDGELHDAARVDGAGRFRCIWHITVPGILPTYTVLLLLQISNLLSVGFEQYFVFYNSLVADKIEVIDYYVYRIGLISREYSFGTAVGMMKSIVSIALLFSVNAFSRRIRGDSII